MLFRWSPFQNTEIISSFFSEDRKHLETKMDEIINSVIKQTETEKQSEKNGNIGSSLMHCYMA